MKIGVTGTREGANASQLAELRSALTILNGTEFHHGDCKGVDEQAAAIAKELGYKIVCHPPKSDYLRAFYPYDEIKEPTGYLERDRAIVDACDLLLVVPLQDKPQPKSGTWYTHRYALRVSKPTRVIWPRKPVDTL